jgi:hypothetical protein
MTISATPKNSTIPLWVLSTKATGKQSKDIPIKFKNLLRKIRNNSKTKLPPPREIVHFNLDLEIKNFLGDVLVGVLNPKQKRMEESSVRSSRESKDAEEEDEE